jgi:hypothetical protein
MKKYLDPFFKKYESIIDKTVKKADNVLDHISHTPKYMIKNYNKIIENIDDSLFDIFNKNTGIARLLRYISLPWSVVIPKGYKYFFSNDFGKSLLYVPGVHMIHARVGGGKSLASFILAEMYLEESGKGSYFTSPVEKPSITDDGEWLYVKHRVINTADYYKNGKKVMNYNTKKYSVMHKDERHLEFNPRLNNTKDYKDRFIPEQKDEILMRHGGFTHIYKYSQYFKLDSQDMQALTYMHEVETLKTIPTKRWLESGTFDYIPVILKFITYKIEFKFDGGMNRKKVGSCKVKIPYELLMRFDTHAESKRYAGLPVDYK